MEVHIDPYAGFCSGVRRALDAAEKAASGGTVIYSLGDIVHNEDEVRRLEDKGVLSIGPDQYLTMEHCHVVIRAHGEPGNTYRHAREHDITLVDATCPVVKRLQGRVSDAAREMQGQKGTVIIFGKKDHPEVKGLVGQAGAPVEIVSSREDVDKLDLHGPLRVFSQTTMDEEKYHSILQYLEEKTSGEMISYRTICRQVAGRAARIREFAATHDVIVFVASPSSSNGKYLFSLCRSVNDRSFMVNRVNEVNKGWFKEGDRVGVSGAASTSEQKLEEIAQYIRKI